MKRYYSHYAFIYPDICLKNCIVELDKQSAIVYYAFEKEIANTIFHSGMLVFIPKGIQPPGKLLLNEIRKSHAFCPASSEPRHAAKDVAYLVYDENGILFD